MTSQDLIARNRKDKMQGEDYAEKKLQENVIAFARDKCITILILSGMKHCDAGYLVNQHKRLFQ